MLRRRKGYKSSDIEPADKARQLIEPAGADQVREGGFGVSAAQCSLGNV